MDKVIAWIDEVIDGGQDIIEKNLKKCLNALGNNDSDGSKFYSLLEEMKENERDNALLSLVKEMIIEERDALATESVEDKS